MFMDRDVVPKYSGQFIINSTQPKMRGSKALQILKLFFFGSKETLSFASPFSDLGPFEETRGGALQSGPLKMFKKKRGIYLRANLNFADGARKNRQIEERRTAGAQTDLDGEDDDAAGGHHVEEEHHRLVLVRHVRVELALRHHCALQHNNRDMT